MAAAVSAAASENSTTQQPTSQQSSRPRGRRGHARRADNSRLSAQSGAIPSAPQNDPAGTTGPEGSRQSTRSGGNGDRRNRGDGRAGRTLRNRTVNGRAFGGQLTRDDTSSSIQRATEGELRAGAAVFTPREPKPQAVQASQSAQKQAKKPIPSRRRASKSGAPDIATRTHEDIDNGFYECPICTNEVQRNSKVWSCHTCWTVFHLTCIKKWSSNEGSSATQQALQDGESPQSRQWRCPGCNLAKNVVPQGYTCWCEKESDPRPPAGLPPHSCGQTCGKQRVRKCPHPCQLTCHAGPCTPCTHMGPTQSCFCGKHETTKRCAETNYTSGWSCGEVCDGSMPCGEHTCTKYCHDGPCGTCEVRLPARCYCGNIEKDILCGDRSDALESQRPLVIEDPKNTLETWTGNFNCGNECDRLLDCGVHQCQQHCHPQEVTPGHCPLSPDIVKNCPCGKTNLNELTSSIRTHCKDPIPHCGKSCGKTLDCGHICPQVCHSGPCPSCIENVTITCRCGRTASKSICHQGKDEPPQCARICRANLNCGRHSCEERCCSGERKAIDRQAARRKQRPLNTLHGNAEDLFEAEHICTRQCGRPLKCGNHFCEELCHKGPCGTCREAIFDEVSCNCGRTVLQPPLPCGTQPPPCRFPCERQKACGHPQVPHNCHGANESCPKCPFLVEKRCMCARKILKNQPCWLIEVRCGEVCGKRLKCGSHFCRKLCHRSGECEDAHGAPCQQPCGKEKKACGHPDEAVCHAPYPCKEDQPCTSKIFITCTCQAQKQELKCGATKSSDGNRSKSLPCNDECARLERNRKLALALNIDQSTHVDGGEHIPYSTETISFFAEHMKWSQVQEREFRVFAAAEEEKRLRFKPMPPPQRAFVHALAEDFGLDSESMDPEPHRHVMVWKTPRFVSAPNKTLADALRIRQASQKSANVMANVLDNDGTSPAKAIKTNAQPYNAFVISNPRFGLTIDEVRSEVNTVLDPTNPITLDINFLPSEQVVIKGVSQTLQPPDLERMLQALKDPLGIAITSKKLGNVQLCSTDSSLNITRLESDASESAGWSRVAAKKAAPRMNIESPVVRAPNIFASLSTGKVTFAKKKPEKPKPKPEVVVDDWEAAELAEEEKERVHDAPHDEEDGGVSTSMIEDNDHQTADIEHDDSGQTTPTSGQE